MITKVYFLAKEKNRIGDRIICANKILRDHR
jgi:hypothetical protein